MIKKNVKKLADGKNGGGGGGILLFINIFYPSFLLFLLP